MIDWQLGLVLTCSHVVKGNKHAQGMVGTCESAFNGNTKGGAISEVNGNTGGGG